MGSVHARGDTFLTFGLKALTETNTSRLATGYSTFSAEGTVHQDGGLKIWRNMLLI
jgi:hypothetical protein